MTDWKFIASPGGGITYEALLELRSRVESLELSMSKVRERVVEIVESKLEQAGVGSAEGARSGDGSTQVRAQPVRAAASSSTTGEGSIPSRQAAPTPASPVVCPECGHEVISHGTHHGCVAPSGIWNRSCRCDLTRSEVESRAAKRAEADGILEGCESLERKAYKQLEAMYSELFEAFQYLEDALRSSGFDPILVHEGAPMECAKSIVAGIDAVLKAKASEPAPTPQPIERGVVANEGSFIRGIIPSPTPSEVPSWVPSADELRSLANRHAPFGISDSVFDEIRRLIASRSPSPSFSATREACARVCEKEAEKWSLGDADSETADCVNWLARRIRALREEDCK